MTYLDRLVGSDEKQCPVILETQHLGRVVGGKSLVDDISIQVHAGEVVTLVGPSGSGKSSLLRLLNRLDEPTSGTVLLNGQDYRALNPRVLRRRVGLVTQRAVLLPGTVAENIRFGPRQQDVHMPDAAIDALLEQVGLHGYGDWAVQHLSGGEGQRVALLRTLVNEPQVLLLDEPTSALDEASEQAVESLLYHYISQQQRACLLVSHKREQIERLSQRVLVFDAGCLVRVEPGMAMMERDNVVQVDS